MERKKLKAARIAKGLREKRKLTQLDVAGEIGCSVDIYNMWERGRSNPQDRWIRKLCQYYDVTDPADLDLMPADRILSLQEIVAMLERYDPRELITQLQAMSIFENVDLTALTESSPNKFLDQCKIVVNIVCCRCGKACVDE